MEDGSLAERAFDTAEGSLDSCQQDISFRQSRTRIRMLSRPQHDIGIETAQPQAPRLQLVNRIQIETPERPLHIRLQRLHEPRFDHKSNLFRFTVCGFELICATSIIG